MLNPLNFERIKGYDNLMRYINRLKNLGYCCFYDYDKDNKEWKVYYNHYQSKFNVKLKV